MRSIFARKKNTSLIMDARFILIPHSLTEQSAREENK